MRPGTTAAAGRSAKRSAPARRIAAAAPVYVVGTQQLPGGRSRGRERGPQHGCAAERLGCAIRHPTCHRVTAYLAGERRCDPHTCPAAAGRRARLPLRVRVASLARPGCSGITLKQPPTTFSERSGRSECRSDLPCSPRARPSGPAGSTAVTSRITSGVVTSETQQIFDFQATSTAFEPSTSGLRVPCRYCHTAGTGGH